MCFLINTILSLNFCFNFFYCKNRLRNFWPEWVRMIKQQMADPSSCLQAILLSFMDCFQQRLHTQKGNWMYFMFFISSFNKFYLQSGSWKQHREQLNWSRVCVTTHIQWQTPALFSQQLSCNFWNDYHITACKLSQNHITACMVLQMARNLMVHTLADFIRKKKKQSNMENTKSGKK